VRTALLVAPTAGRGAAGRVAGSVAAVLRTEAEALNGTLDTLVADSAAGSARLAGQAVRDGVDVLAVLGGDGLAHLAVQACAGSGTALAVIPAGTGNDLARALGLPADSIAAAEVVAGLLRSGGRRRIDLGRVSGGAWFGTVLCAGFDSAVNARANALRWPSGPRRYDVAIVAELARLRPRPLAVCARTPDGDEDLRLDATMVAVGNTAYYGGGIPICPAADPADGLFDVTVVGAVPRRDLVRMLPTLRTGRHVDHPAVRTLRASSIRLSGNETWLGYADGEPQAALPLELSCVPGALAVLAP
jgi:diacylglycerol kinase (ATP)